MKKYNFIKIENCGSLVIYKRPDYSSNYQGLFFYGTDNNGRSRRIRFSLKTDSLVDAKRIAKEKFFEFHSKNNLPIISKKTVKVLSDENTFDYFFKKYKEHLDELVSVKEVDEKQLSVIESRYQDYIKRHLGNLNVRDITTSHIDKIKIDLLNGLYSRFKKRLQTKTINGYFYLIKNVLKKAIEYQKLDKIPVFPKLKIHTTNNPNSYKPYTKDEIHQITEELRRISKKDITKSHYDEIADIVNFLYFVPLRPGKEFLSLTHHDVKMITSISNNQRDEILVIDPPTRKVMTYRHPIPSHPIAKDIYIRRILKRYPRKTGNEFLFFNNEPNRRMETLQRKISKIFVKVSKSLNLYYVQNSTRNRPLYSVRTSNFIETYARSGQLDLTAKVGNSSSKMLTNNYLNQFSEMKVVEIYNKLYKSN
jgi:hypothetical protein